VVNWEAEKKHKYSQACHNRRATFTPLCASVDGVLGPETEFFVKRLSDFLAAKWESPYGVVMGWVQDRLSFAILWATLLCVCVVVAPSRGVWELLMVPLCLFCLLINFFCVWLCSVLLFCSCFCLVKCHTLSFFKDE